MNWTYFWIGVSVVLYLLGAVSHYHIGRDAQAEAGPEHVNLRIPESPYAIAALWPSLAFSLLFDRGDDNGDD